MKLFIIILLTFSLYNNVLYAQSSNDFTSLSAQSSDNFTKTLSDVKEIYPLINQISKQWKWYKSEYSKCKSQKEKDKLTEDFSDAFEDIFLSKLMDLTKSQGKILIKLIHKETGKTVYELVSMLDGTFKSKIYQALANSFGNDLNSKFDPIKDIDIQKSLNIIAN